MHSLTDGQLLHCAVSVLEGIVLAEANIHYAIESNRKLHLITLNLIALNLLLFNLFKYIYIFT